MIFASYEYVVFALAAFLLYWTIPGEWRKPFLVAASYLFYCTWRWEFGFLLLGISLFNYAYARWILAKAETTTPLVIGILINVAALAYFKYTFFLLENLRVALHLFGGHWQAPTFTIIVPLGISFFTFQGIAYLFDVATGEPPLTSLLDFLLFKAFWPQLIAGPIVRLHEMRAQLEIPRRLDYADVADGSRRILYGLFKKVVLADNLAPTVEAVFLPGSHMNFLDSGVGIVAFGLQIYFDFSAYSDIAIGTARLFGYRFPENFNWPYISRSPSEFWNRWHITLSHWIRDYLFTPLTFATRKRPVLAPIWLLVAMALCGLWHGPAWTFILWGIWHGVWLIANQSILKKFFAPASPTRAVSALHSATQLLVTFAMVQLGWVLFRATSMAQAVDLCQAVVTFRGRMQLATLRQNAILFVVIVFIGLFIAQVARNPLDRLRQRVEMIDHLLLPVFRPIIYTLMIAAIIIADPQSRAFVYFQF